MEAMEAEVQKLIECGFIREEQHSDCVANIVSILKKNKKIWVCINFHDLNIACPKDEFPFSIMDVMIISVVLKGYPLWMAFHGTTKSRCTQMMKSIHHSEHHWVCFVIRFTVWLKACGCHLPTCNERNLP